MATRWLGWRTNQRWRQARANLTLTLTLTLWRTNLTLTLTLTLALAFSRLWWRQARCGARAARCSTRRGGRRDPGAARRRRTCARFSTGCAPRALSAPPRVDTCTCACTPQPCRAYRVPASGVRCRSYAVYAPRASSGRAVRTAYRGAPQAPPSQSSASSRRRSPARRCLTRGG